MKNPTILANWIMCPDGTMIPSFHRHDYRAHTSVDSYYDKDRTLNTMHSVNDGGSDYIRRAGVYTDMTVYDTDPFDVIRRFVCRCDKNDSKGIIWTPLFRMSESWIKSVLQYNKDNNIKSKYDEWFQRELDYREDVQFYNTNLNER